MLSRFDLEQQIMNAWYLVDEIKTLTQELDTAPATTKELAERMERVNVVLKGLVELYQIKFNHLFSTFEKLIANKQI